MPQLFETTDSAQEYVTARVAAGPATRLTELIQSDDPGVKFTPTEIAQQPRTWTNTVSRLSDSREALVGFLGKADLFNPNPDLRPELVFSGAGTSDYVGMCVKYALQSGLQVPAHAVPSTDTTIALFDELLPHRNYLIVHFARSGDSPESEGTLLQCLNGMPDNVRHLAITCNKDGVLAQYSREQPDSCFAFVLDPSTNDGGLAMTSSFSSMAVAALGLSHLREGFEGYRTLAHNLSLAGERVMDNIDSIADLGTIERAFYLGTGSHYGTATESALKMQELTQGAIITKPETFLAFKHGPISAVDGESLMVYFLDSDPLKRAYELPVIEKIAAECDATKHIVVCDKMPEELEQHGMIPIETDPNGQLNIPDQYRAPVYVIVGQSLGLLQSVALGMSPDAPSGDEGDASYTRVVKPFTLHDGVHYRDTCQLRPLATKPRK